MTANPFDEKAATWDDDPAKRERARVVARAIRAAVPLGASTRMLEYGAGTGLVSQELREHVGTARTVPPCHCSACSGMVVWVRALGSATGREEIVATKTTA